MITLAILVDGNAWAAAGFLGIAHLFTPKASCAGVVVDFFLHSSFVVVPL
jgi:hypothetical protein